jgi:hypothetical protein
MPKQRLLWVNRDADNLKSRESATAINTHVQQWKKANTKARHERARQLHAKVSRTYFPWQRRQEVVEVCVIDSRLVLAVAD